MKALALLLFLTVSFADDFTFNKETGKAVPQFVGELKLLRGSAQKITGGRPRSVKTGERFYPGDIVTTEKGSTIKILITDDTWLALGPDSELVFKEFKFRDKTDRDITYELKKGQLASNVRQKLKAGEVRFRSRYSSMGVRGTKILMNYREVKGKSIAEYALVEGRAEVKDDEGKVLDLKAGERVVLVKDLKSGNSFSESLKLSPEELESYVSPEAEEEKTIAPFLPYFDLVEEVQEEATAKVQPKVQDEPSETESKGSFENLRKLNEELDQNQKRRR